MGTVALGVVQVGVLVLGGGGDSREAEKGARAEVTGVGSDLRTDGRVTSH